MAETELDDEQQQAVRKMMTAIVERDEAVVAELLRHRPPSEFVYAAPASNFWMWADNYGDQPLKLAMPPGDVDDWGVWGFSTPNGSPGELSLHVDVWADSGRTDLTIQFRLLRDANRWRVELEDMHVM